MEPEENTRKSKPWVAIVITGVLLGLGIQDQLSSGSIDSPLLGGLVVLAFFWAGQSVDKLWRRL